MSAMGTVQSDGENPAIAPLARNALGRIGRRLELEPPRLGPALYARLAAHPWPGNVRELENLIERLAIRCPGRAVEPSDLAEVLEEDPWHGGRVTESEESEVREAVPDLRNLSAERIRRALLESQGNVARAARRLGLSRTTLRRRIEGLGLRPGASAEASERQALEQQQSQGDQGRHR